MSRFLIAGLVCLALIPTGTEPLTRSRIAGTPPPNPEVDQESPQAEIAAYHAATDRIFATNAEANTLDVYQGVLSPRRIASLPVDGGPNSVAVRPDGLVAVAVEADPKTAPGQVEFFSAATLARLGDA